MTKPRLLALAVFIVAVLATYLSQALAQTPGGPVPPGSYFIPDPSGGPGAGYWALRNPNGLYSYIYQGGAPNCQKGPPGGYDPSANPACQARGNGGPSGPGQPPIGAYYRCRGCDPLLCHREGEIIACRPGPQAPISVSCPVTIGSLSEEGSVIPVQYNTNQEVPAPTLQPGNYRTLDREYANRAPNARIRIVCVEQVKNSEALNLRTPDDSFALTRIADFEGYSSSGAG
jgi:hypothetical protein